MVSAIFTLGSRRERRIRTNLSIAHHITEAGSAWNAKKEKQMRVEELTFFRFFAATIVVIFHFGRDATGLGGLLVSGPQMVTFFFVLSGFVMGIAYHGKELNSRSYWWARVARIMPAYLLAIFIMVLISFIQGGQLNYVSLVLNLSLLQSWVSPHPLSINAPGWSLSVEAFFYLSFPFLLHAIKHYDPSVKQLTLGCISFWAITQVITTTILSGELYGGYPSFTHDLVYYFPITHFCSFIIGVCGAKWFLNSRIVIHGNLLSLVLLFFTSFLLVFFMDSEGKLHRATGLHLPFASSFYAPLFAIFIVVVSICRSRVIKIFSLYPLVLLGEASFSLYILQLPLHELYVKYISNIHDLSKLNSFLLFFLILTLTSIASFILFEKPASNFIRTRIPILFDSIKNIFRG